MATVTYQNGIEVLPSIGDLAEVFNGLIVTSNTANTLVMENAFGRITLTAGTAFTYAAGQNVPATGTIASIAVEVYSAANVLVDFMSVDYGLAPVQSNTIIAAYGSVEYGYTVYFTADNMFSGNDQLSGTSSADWIQGRAGNDSITGAGGDDTLDGGGQTAYYSASGDTLVGGAGDDVYIVRNSIAVTGDQVIEGAAAGTGNDTVVLFNGGTYTLPENVENLEVAPAWLIGNVYSFATGIVTGNALGNIMRGGLYGADNLMGMGGNDRLFGLGGNDTLDGGAGADLMAGGDGDDTYYVDAAGDKVMENTTTIYSVPGIVNGDTVHTTVNHTLGSFVENLTFSGANPLNGAGNTLNNHIVGNNAKNVVNGLAGNDTFSFQTAVTKVTASLVTGAATGGGGADVLSNIENLIGGVAGDALTGSGAANRLDGYTGADTLTGLAGDDTYVVDDAGDTLVEGVDKGTDTVESSVSRTLATNFENLTLTGGYTAINGTGNAVANLLTGNYGTNILLGLDGNDTIRAAPVGYSSSGDSMDGGVGADSLVGSYSNDTMLGGAGNDVLSGDSGDDSLDGGAGTDTMQGSYGNDTYYVDNIGDLVIDVQEPDYPQYNIYITNTVHSKVNYALPFAIDNLFLVGSNALRGAGNYLDNVITVNPGNVSNVLNGARGIDTLSYALTTGAVTVSLAIAGAQATGGSGSDTVRNFENLTGGGGNDTLTGNADNNVLDGGIGNDALRGGKGDDTYLVDSTQDAVTETAGNGNDTVRTQISGVTLAAEVENLVIYGGTAANGTGNGLANMLTGNGYANALTGLGGDDLLDGAAGADTLDGGAGNDTYKLDTILDQVIDSGGTDLVMLVTEGFAYQNYVMPTGIENLEFTMPTYYYGYPANATGNALPNTMRGNNGANQLAGDAGADTLSGGGGSDTLTGGAGADLFVFDAPLLYTYDSAFNAALHGFDTITDFTPGSDRIALDDDIFAALPTAAAGGFLAANLRVGVQATTADHRIIYNSSTGALYYDADGSGVQAALQFAQIATGLALTAASFTIT